jgi:hypothetical protein
MPKSYEDIMKHADELSAYMEHDFVGVESPEEAALKAAAYRRAKAEADVLEAVKEAAAAGRSWRSIGAALGTSGEAARQRYSKFCKLHPQGGKYSVRQHGQGAHKSVGRKVAGVRKSASAQKS